MTSIEYLSEDVLLHIFGFLDGNALKNAALVCKFWNDVISESSTITRIFTLNLNDNTQWISKFDEIMSVRRRFQSINIVLHSSNQPYIIETWTNNAIQLLLQATAKHGQCIRKMTLRQAEFRNAQDLINLMSSMPLLQELTLHRVKFDQFNVEDNCTNENGKILTKLNKLTVHTCDWNIFNFFMASPVQELHISNKFIFIDVQQFGSYVKFLETSRHLESIEFDLTSYGKTFRNPMDSKICLQLKRLKYLSFSPGYEIDEIDRNFGLFIQSQSASLMELDLNYVSPGIVNIIFTKLNQLKKLRLNAVVLPTENEFYAPFRAMPFLKELILHDDIPSESAVKGILLNCSSLETLTAYHDRRFIPNLFTFVAANCPMLKNLSLDSLPIPSVASETKFNHLKYLHIHTCTQQDNVLAFLSTNVTIETLSLKLVEEFPANGDIWDNLLKQPNLQHLIVAAESAKLNEIFDKIKFDYRKLKSLELRPVAGGVADKVFIKFPSDKSKWQPNECIFPPEKKV